MNLVDSSGWLEYFTDDKNAKFFATIWTQDYDFKNLNDVKFIKK